MLWMVEMPGIRYNEDMEPIDPQRQNGLGEFVMVIRLTSAIETVLNREAKRCGVTPEQLALDSLEKMFLTPESSEVVAGERSLYDCLAGHVGVVDGSPEAFSENCGRRFADGLAAKHEQGCL
jgi:hypothetical protein